ncbi:MAG: pyruvate kinase [Thermodesulfobacteriota bacterium]
MTSKKIIVTIGPSFMNACELRELHRPGSYIYRINSSHLSLESIAEYILWIRSEIPDAHILVDIPGNKVRTTNIDEPVAFRKGHTLILKSRNLTYSDFHSHLAPGMTLTAQDGLYKFEVLKSSAESIHLSPLCDGILINNKGIHANGASANLPFLFEKDLAIIALAREKKISHLGLSYVRDVEDIRIARRHIGEGISIIAKIETRAAVLNRKSIMAEVDSVLIDRGDLSLDVGIENIPYYVELIVKDQQPNNNVFIATQFLKNMEHHPIPLLSEVTDIYNTLRMNICGIQLSEETAVGLHPSRCLEVIDEIRKTIDTPPAS